MAASPSRRCLIRFVQASRALFGPQGSSSVLELFKPSRHIGLRLSGYGIHSRIPCTQVLLCLSTAHAAMMHAQLLTLKPFGKKKKTNSGRTTVSFKFPANPPWAHLCNSIVLPELIEARAERRLAADTACIEGTGGCTPKPTSFVLECPRQTCGSTHCFSNVRLISGTMWRQLKCKSCKRASSAAKWHCPCGLRWHHCPTHRPSGFLCGSKPRFKRTRITKRTFPGVLGEPGPVPRPSNNALQRPSISQAFVYPSDPYHLRRTKRQCSARLTGQLCVDGDSNYSERASYGDQRILPAPCMQLQYTNTNAPAHNVSGLPCSHCWKRGGEITGLCICDDIAIAALNRHAFQAKLPRQLNVASGASQRSCHRMACEATANAITESLALLALMGPLASGKAPIWCT